MSDESRLKALEAALAARLPPRVVTIQLRVVTSREQWLREQAEAAARPPRPQPPAIKGQRVKVVVLTSGDLYRNQRKESSDGEIT